MVTYLVLRLVYWVVRANGRYTYFMDAWLSWFKALDLKSSEFR